MKDFSFYEEKGDTSVFILCIFECILTEVKCHRNCIHVMMYMKNCFKYIA